MDMKKYNRTMRSLMIPGLLLAGCVGGTVLSGCGNSSDPNSGASNPNGSQTYTVQQQLDAIDKDPKMPAIAKAQAKAIVLAHQQPSGATTATPAAPATPPSN